MSKAFTEITRLSEKDCFYIVERHKTEFTYPLHQHKEFELNFIEHGKGVRRIVGDSVEEIGDYELVLIGGQDLEHVWEQGRCKSKDIREITIQFSSDIFGDEILSKNPDLASSLFNAFDMSVLPFLVESDEDGIIVSRYFSFLK